MIAFITRWKPAPSAAHSSSLARHDLPGETILIGQPAALHFLAAAGGELLPEMIDLLLRLAFDDERDRRGKLEFRSAVQGHELLARQLEGHGHDRAFFADRLFPGVARHFLDLRVLENRDVELSRLFRLIIEPQKWRDPLHRSLCFSLGAHFRHRLLHLLRRHVADMGRDRPLMAERIFHFPVAIAPEHVVERHRHLRARLHRLREKGVRVLDIKMDRDRRTLERFRAKSNPTAAISSFSMMTESPIRMLACMTLPSGAGDADSVRPRRTLSCKTRSPPPRRRRSNAA